MAGVDGQDHRKAAAHARGHSVPWPLGTGLRFGHAVDENGVHHFVPVSRVRAVIFSLQWSVRFPQGVGYEHSTDRFRSAQALRANAAGRPIGADRFRLASPLRTNGAGSPVRCGDGSRSRAGGTCLCASRTSSRHPTGAGSRACGEPPGAGTAGRRQPRRWVPGLAQEVVRRLNRRREASALQGRQHCRRTWDHRRPAARGRFGRSRVCCVIAWSRR